MISAIPKWITPNVALLIDAAGCFVGAAALLLAPSLWEFADLPAGWRLPVIVALFLFSLILVAIARYPGRVSVSIAVLGNLAWILAGAFALVATGSIPGAAIIALVMVADAVMAWYQAQDLKTKNVVASNNNLA